MTRAIITVAGKDAVGILAKITGACAEANVNVLDVSQTVMRDEIFTMAMLVDVSKCNLSFTEFSEKTRLCVAGAGLEVNVMREEIFNSMRRIDC